MPGLYPGVSADKKFSYQSHREARGISSDLSVRLCKGACQRLWEEFGHIGTIKICLEIFQQQGKIQYFCVAL